MIDSLLPHKTVLYESRTWEESDACASMIIHTGFPLGLENLEKWEGIFQSGKSQGILNRLEKSGKSQGKPHKILEN